MSFSLRHEVVPPHDLSFSALEAGIGLASEFGKGLLIQAFFFYFYRQSFAHSQTGFSMYSASRAATLKWLSFRNPHPLDYIFLLSNRIRGSGGMGGGGYDLA